MVVACEDFTDDDRLVLLDYESIKNNYSDLLQDGLIEVNEKLSNRTSASLTQHNVRIEDIYEHFKDDSYLYLNDLIRSYTQFDDMGLIYDREADDIQAAYDNLQKCYYWSALRNLYSLVDHHHKLCAQLFNGYWTAKKEYKNPKERVGKIDKLFNSCKLRYYEKAWNKINYIWENISKGCPGFISRNAIVHGDYQNIELEPTYKDVINMFFLYVNLREMTEHFSAAFEIIKNYKLNVIGYLGALEKAKNRL